MSKALIVGRIDHGMSSASGRHLYPLRDQLDRGGRRRRIGLLLRGFGCKLGLGADVLP